MKRIILGVYAIFVLMLGGCDFPDGDFATMKPIIVNKRQDEDQKFRGNAKYEVRFDMGGGISYDSHWYIFPENFGNVGDLIVFSNNMMYAKPPMTKKPEE